MVYDMAVSSVDRMSYYSFFGNYSPASGNAKQLAANYFYQFYDSGNYYGSGACGNVDKATVAGNPPANIGDVMSNNADAAMH